MARKEEIERKFLVIEDRLPRLPPGARMAQAYLGFAPTVRVRTQLGPGPKVEAFLTIKGAGLVGRDEFEYSIPYEEGEALLRLGAHAPVEKVRHYLPVEGTELTWEIDVFEGPNAGLIVAEIELPSRDSPFPQPEWLGEDVTLDPRYKNAALAQRPFREWP
jgi:adenylate cyclase